jgi:hypothetical protein
VIWSVGLQMCGEERGASILMEAWDPF